MKVKNILLCIFLFAAGGFIGKKAHKWQEGRARELKVPTLEREFIGIEESPERDVYLFLHSKNHSQAICRSLSTINKQKYSKLHIFYFDENSTDGTWEKALQYIDEQHVPVEFTMHGNRRALKDEAAQIIEAASPETLIISLEGKDWLPHDRVVQLVNHKIAEEKCSLLLGQLSTYPKYELGIASRWIKIKVDQQKWPRAKSFTKVFKAFRASLFQKTPGVDLFDLQDAAVFRRLYEAAKEKTFFSKSVYYVDNRLEPGKKLLFSEGE
ncbi:MAG: glycosyltransferase [Candidatus Algichlamydia australiensis]|nr:glycosyltransferase [Chlamydiales bacterium]